MSNETLVHEGEIRLDTSALAAPQTQDVGTSLEQTRQQLSGALAAAEVAIEESGVRVREELDALLAELDELAEQQTSQQTSPQTSHVAASGGGAPELVDGVDWGAFDA